jgi:N-hydroxyarylamine O-acetyltransferase
MEPTVAQASLDLDAYFERIGYSAERAPTLEVLERVHELHPRAIPFENLSPLLGETVALDVPSLEEKLVRGGRGGYCFEHNLLLQNALNRLGFDVRGLAARVVYNARPDARPIRGHMLLLVNVAGEEYIADVGFGGHTMSRPLRLAAGVEQSTRHGVFRLLEAGGGYRLEIRSSTGGWAPLYIFDLQEQQVADYEVASWYLCNHPDSAFVNGLMAARLDSDRRHALQSGRYTVHCVGGPSHTRLLTDVGDLMRTLEEAFRVRLPAHPALRDKLESVLEPR